MECWGLIWEKGLKGSFKGGEMRRGRKGGRGWDMGGGRYGMGGLACYQIRHVSFMSFSSYGVD